MMRLRKNFFKIGLASVLVFTGAAFAFLNAIEAAGSATLSLSPSSGTHQVGSNFTVTIYENSGSTQVNTVQADLSYNASQLQFVSISGSGSAFAGSVVATGGGGSVQITRYVEPLGQTTSGNRLVARVTFRVLGNSGTTNVTFASSSAIVGPGTPQTDGGAWNQSPTGGTYTMTPVPATPPPEDPEPSEDPDGSSSPNNNQTPPDTNEQDKNQANQANKQADDPVVVGKDITNQGYPIAIEILGDDGKIVAGASVSLGTETVTTDDSGIASFTSVLSGTHTVGVEIEGQPSFEKTIDVVDGEPGKVQEFSLQRQDDSGGIFTPIVLGAALGGVLLLVGGVALTHFLSNRRELNRHMPPQSASSPSSIEQRLESFKGTTPEPSKVISPDNKEQH